MFVLIEKEKRLRERKKRERKGERIDQLRD